MYFYIIAASNALSRQCATCALDLVFVLDSSGSVGSDNWHLLLTFVASVVEAFTISPIDTRVGVVVYSNSATSEFYLNTYYDAATMSDHIFSIRWQPGNTNTSGGLREMTFQQFGRIDRGDRPDVPNMAIVITDGRSTRDGDRTIPDAETARDRGIQIISVGISDMIDVNEIQEMSSHPQMEGSNYILRHSFHELDQALINIFCSQASCTSKNSGWKLYLWFTFVTLVRAMRQCDKVQCCFSNMKIAMSRCYEQRLYNTEPAVADNKLLPKIILIYIFLGGSILRKATDFAVLFSTVQKPWERLLVDDHGSVSFEPTEVRNYSFVILPPSEAVITLTFREFHIGEKQTECISDYVEVNCWCNFHSSLPLFPPTTPTTM